ncbi:uncharacterized protein IWZ02DRAFT_300491 [Phyllosticta citriasiana]|uniref:uncharacterized protein n=1 Tax=Phyllosticta citriasiana TaxID=595635 RepID=UPI0030FD2A47
MGHNCPCPDLPLMTITQSSTFNGRLCPRIRQPLDDLAPITLTIAPSPFAVFQLGSHIRFPRRTVDPLIRDFRTVSYNRQVVVAVEITPPSAISKYQTGSALLGMYSWIRSAALRKCLRQSLRVLTTRFASPLSDLRASRSGKTWRWCRRYGREGEGAQPKGGPSISRLCHIFAPGRLQGKSSSGNKRDRLTEGTLRQKNVIGRNGSPEQPTTVTRTYTVSLALHHKLTPQTPSEWSRRHIGSLQAARPEAPLLLPTPLRIIMPQVPWCAHAGIAPWPRPNAWLGARTRAVTANGTLHLPEHAPRGSGLDVSLILFTRSGVDAVV